jgi:hypothetical protein
MMAMETLNIILVILGLIITLLIALIPFFRKIYFVGPEITIEFIPEGGQSTNEGLSNKNEISKGYIDGNNAIHVFKVTWNIKIKISNNSPVIAYYPELKLIDAQLRFSYLEDLDMYKPIQENEQLFLKAKFTIFEEAKAQDRIQPAGLTHHLYNIQILLSYKNQHKKNFYTVYTNQNKQNSFHRILPSELKNKIK